MNENFLMKQSKKATEAKKQDVIFPNKIAFRERREKVYCLYRENTAGVHRKSEENHEKEKDQYRVERRFHEDYSGNSVVTDWRRSDEPAGQSAGIRSDEIYAPFCIDLGEWHFAGCTAAGAVGTTCGQRKKETVDRGNGWSDGNRIYCDGRVGAAQFICVYRICFVFPCDCQYFISVPPGV